MLNSYLFVFAAYHSLAEKLAEKHPRWSICHPLSVLLRLHEPRSTLRSLIYTPRGSHSCIVLELLFDCGSFESPKTKRKVTPFNM